MTIHIPMRVIRRGAALALILVVLVGAIAQAPIYRNDSLGVWSHNSWLSVKMAFVERVDRLFDQLPDEPVMTDKRQMEAWALEILPYMPYEGLIVGEARLPAELVYFWSPTARAFHVGGWAACATYEPPGPVALNLRFINPMSPKYGDEWSLGTLVHELIHMQGGSFCSGTSEDLEANTQIATVEVLAAMVNHGNMLALRSLLAELRSMGLADLQFELPRAAYLDFYYSLEPDPLARARAAKAYRFWMANAPSELNDILRKYNYVPFEALLEGAHDGTVERVQVPYLVTTQEQPVVGAPLVIASVIEYRSLMVDDFRYFLAHAEEYVAAAR